MGSPSSIQAVKSPVAVRLRAVLSTLNGFVMANDDAGLAKFAFIMQAVTDEVIEELEDKDEDAIKAFMMSMGEVIAWIGHGDNKKLPETMQAFARNLEPVEA